MTVALEAETDKDALRSIKAYLAEWLGTFCLVLAGTGAVMADIYSGGTAITHVGVALVFGLVVMAMIYAVGETSGAHLNPAVTIAFWAAGRFPFKQILPYILAQCLGAIAASALLYALFFQNADAVASMGASQPAEGVFWWQAFLWEVVLTAILMFVILCVSSGSKEVGMLAGVAIGATVALEAMFAGPMCGASMNPARSLGPALFMGQWATTLWIYIVAPIIGAVMATGWSWFMKANKAGCACGTLDCK